MRRDRDDRDLSLFRTVTPENTVGGWRRLFRISLEYVLAVRTDQRLEFVALKAGMARIRLEPGQGLTNCVETLGESGIALQLLERRLCSGRQVQ